jgi:asparagine synthase (glutamine-hydrolysing)
MSAVYGIINKNGNPADQVKLDKMRLALSHRAKHGSAQSASGNAGFGFCKLAIHPQQESEQLPVETETLLFTANAHLHNREELMGKLGLDKMQHANTPDSLLILKAFEKWEEHCVHHLDGEYVYAVWNKQSRQLFISKDHIGYKALYYYDTPGAFIFCSEIKGIEAVKQTTNEFDEETLVHTFFFQGDQSATYNKEIKSLTGGCSIKLKDNAISVSRYWQLEKKGRYSFAKDTEWFDCYRDLLIKAVTVRMNPDVPIGVRLSGGLDSSGIACILSKVLAEKNKPLYSFSSVLPAGYRGEAKDEREYIEAVLQACPNIIPTYISAEGPGPYDDIPAVFEREEGVPYILHFMDTAISKAAQEKNISILFSGMGGDHGASGHGSDILYNMIMGLRWRDAGRVIKELRKKDHDPWSIFRSYILLRMPLYQFYRKHRAWHRESAFHSRFRKTAAKSSLEEASRLFTRVNNGATGRMMQRLDNRHEYYQMSTADPLVDRNILEFLADMPEMLMLKGGYRRSHYRHAMEGLLPPAIQWREGKTIYVADGADRMPVPVAALEEVFSDDEAGQYFQKIINKEVFFEMYAYFDRPPGSDTRKIPFLFGQIFLSRLALEILKKKKYKLVSN